MKTVVLGASTNSRRYSHRAVLELLNEGHQVVAVGLKKGEINGLKITPEYPSDDSIRTVAMYISEKNQEPYIKAILQNPPERVIFNPGTYNPNFEKELNSAGVETIRSCVLIMLSQSSY